VSDARFRTGTGFGEYVPGAGELPTGFEVLYPGEMGGKARGLLYAALMKDRGLRLAREHTHLVNIPPSAILGTDLYDEVLRENDLRNFLAEEPEEGREREHYEAFLRARLPDRAREVIRAFLERTEVPLALRSSSLLEDHPRYSFSGIYRTWFFSNTGPLDRRIETFETAVRIVLGSLFLPRAWAYRRRHGLNWEEEKMAILVQNVVGRQRGPYFYPLVAGVGFSKNFYPWADRISVDDGVVRMVYGLGTRAVDREFARVFVPTQPRLRPEGFEVDAIEEYAQEKVDALSLEGRTFHRGIPARDLLSVPGNDLHLVSDLVREGEFLRPPQFPLTPDDRFVITFDEIIAGKTEFPLVPILRGLFESLENALGMPVDIEFACAGVDDESETIESLDLLQVRPLGVREANRRIEIDTGDHPVRMRSHRVMGNGERRDIRHIVLVLEQEYRAVRHDRTVREVRRLNRLLAGKPYMLVGPGRWGTTNPTLGVPVTYDAVSECSVIVEVATGEMSPEVSYGTHFFGDLLSSGVHYLALVPREGDVFDEAWLVEHATPPVHGVRLVELDGPLVIQVDGQSRSGVVFAPEARSGKGEGS